MTRNVKLRRSPSTESYFSRQVQLDMIGPEQESGRRVDNDLLYRPMNATPRMEITIDASTGAHHLNGRVMLRRDSQGLGASLRWVCGMGQTKEFEGVDSTSAAAKWRSIQSAFVQMMLILCAARQTVPQRGYFYLASQDFNESPNGQFIIHEMNSTMIQYVKASKKPQPFDLIENGRSLDWRVGITTTSDNIADGVTIGALLLYVHYQMAISYRPVVQHMPRAQNGRDANGRVRTELDNREYSPFCTNALTLLLL